MPLPSFYNKFLDVHRKLLQGNDKVAISIMEKWQPAYLGLFHVQFPQHSEKLGHSNFAEFWKTKREALRLPSDADFRFRAQSNVNDMDLVLGHVFYLLALKNKADPTKFERYLKLAMDHSSLQALSTLLHTLVASPKEKISDHCDTLAKALSILESYAIHHGTPGYLLLANGYLQLALAAQGKSEEVRQDEAFKLVLKYLHLAKLAEDHSEDEIYNAYYGKGVALGNPFKIDSIDKMLEYCRDLAAVAVPHAIQNFIRTQARAEYETHMESAALSAAGPS